MWLLFTQLIYEKMARNLNAVKGLIPMLTAACLSLSAVAADPPESGETTLSISPGGTSGTVVVRAWNLSADAPATIKILNKYGTVVYEERVDDRDEHSKQYNFSQMKSGKYTLVLENRAGELKKPFVVGINGVVREDKSAAYRNFRPMIIEKKQDQSVFVGFSNVADTPLTLAVTNLQGDMIYSTEVAGRQDYHQLINLKKLNPGDYHIKVYNPDYSYQRTVKNY